jgi:peptide/nickel transport system permease protein
MGESGALSLPAGAGSIGFSRRISAQPALNWLRRNPLGAFGAVILAALLVTAALAPVIAPYDPNKSLSHARLLGPSASHLMGTDNLSRDLLSRIVYGARVSLYVGFASVLFGVVFGTALGLLSGYAGGWLDNTLQRAVDIMMAMPSLILAMALVAMLGPSLRNITLAIAVGAVPSSARIIRGTVLSVKQEDYVVSARVVGATTTRIVYRHVLPNTLAPLIVIGSLAFGAAIIAEASLSFLGLGVQPPTPSWGVMLSGTSRRFMLVAPWMAIFPGLAISLVIFGINVLGDSIRDTFDPRLRS